MQFYRKQRGDTLEMITSMKNFIWGIAAAISAGITFISGGWTTDVVFLVVFMAIDFITGIIVAAVFKKSKKSQNGVLESNVSLKGLLKKGTILLMVIVAHIFDQMLHTDFVRTTLIIGFIVNEAISILENVDLMGIDVPVLNKAIELLKKKGDEANE